MLRANTAILATLMICSCGDGTGQPAPSSPSGPGSPSSWSISGQLTDTLNGQPVSGATIALEGQSPATTAADGRWRVEGSGKPQPRLSATVRAAGYVTRETSITWETGGRSDVKLDVIAERAPFAIGFYRSMVRNGLEEPGSLQAVRRWTRNPNFYIHTFNPKTQRPLEQREVSGMIDAIRETVPQLTGGVFEAGAVETGETAREARANYVNVQIVYEPGQDFCGRALVGANPGLIEINYDRCGSACSNKVTPTALAHEVGHALGFWHVDRGIMTAVVSKACSNVQFTDAEKIHGSLAYLRPVGNTDPDHDPPAFSAVVTDSAPGIACKMAR